MSNARGVRVVPCEERVMTELAESVAGRSAATSGPTPAGQLFTGPRDLMHDWTYQRKLKSAMYVHEKHRRDCPRLEYPYSD